MRKSQGPAHGRALRAAKSRKGEGGPNLTTKFSKSQIFDFPKLAPERSWDIAGMVGRVQTRSKHTAAPARLAPRFLACMTLSRQSTGTARNRKIREISESSKSRNPQNLGIPKLTKYLHFKSRKFHKIQMCCLTSTQHFQTLFTPRPHSQPTARNAEAPTCPCGAGSSIQFSKFLQRTKPRTQ